MTRIQQQLHSLTRRFPLPEDARLQEPFTEAVDVRGVVIHTVGLAAEFRGECITGSAGSLADAPVVRAYMELLERLCVASMTPSVGASQDAADSASWRASRSNGVAIGVSFEDAARRARLELIERDRVLRSWFGGTAPLPLEIGGLVPSALLDVYSFEGCLFEAAHGAQTAGVFGFPLRDAPLVYGFAARDSVEGGSSAALDECLQRLGFLWGEPVPARPPEPASTPSFHQEHYLCPENHDVLRRWLCGAHVQKAARFVPSSLTEPPAVEELRPEWLPSSLWVARALPRGHLPLGFGVAPPFLDSMVPVAATVHPVV